MEVVALAITLYPASGQAMRHQDLQYRQELRVCGYRHTNNCLFMQQTGMTHSHMMHLQLITPTVS